MKAIVKNIAVTITVLGAIGAFSPIAAAQENGDDSAEGIQSEEVEKALADYNIVAAGQTSFIKCQACHMVGENAQRRVGPPLNGIVGRAAGLRDGFNYSPGMKAAAQNGLVWTVEKLDAYLTAPRDIVPATTMGFAGLPNPDERKALIAYLASFSADGSRIVVRDE